MAFNGWQKKLSEARRQQKSRTHCCPALGCRVEIADWLLLCPDHYKLVSKATKDALAAEWAYCKKSGIKHTQKLLALQREAIAEVHQKQQARAAKANAVVPDMFSAGAQ